MTESKTADWCEVTENLAICGTHMVEYHRESLGERWCFHHRKREEFFRVCYEPAGLSYYGPEARYEGPTLACTDLFPGWTREWDED